MPKIKGTLLSIAKQWIKEKGKEEEILASLPPKTKVIFENPIPTKFYEIKLINPLLEAMVKIIGKGNEAILNEYGAYEAERISKTYMRFLLKFVTPEGLIKRIPIFSKRNFTPGYIKINQLKKGYAVVSLCEFKGGKLFCPLITGRLRRTLEIIGAKEIEVRETKCIYRTKDDHCEWEIKWK